MSIRVMMRPFAISMLSVLVYSMLADSHAEPNADQLLKQIQSLNSINSKTCLSPTPSPSASPIPSISSTALEKIPGTTIEVSVVSLKKANQLFQEMKSHKEIPFDYPEDGCYARAHRMAMLLEKQGIIVAKGFVEGDLSVNTKNSKEGYVRWWYHVAPVLLVRDEKTSALIPYIIDPSVFDEAVPMSKWTGIQTSDNQKECTNRIYYTNRFSYTPFGGNGMPKTNYNPAQVTDADETIKRYHAAKKNEKAAAEQMKLEEEMDRTLDQAEEKEKAELMEIKRKMGSGIQFRKTEDGKYEEITR